MRILVYYEGGFITRKGIVMKWYYIVIFAVILQFIWSVSQVVLRNHASGKGDKVVLIKFIELAGFLSNDNEEIKSEVSLYFNDRHSYYEKYKDKLQNRGIKSQDEMRDNIVLIDALLSKNKLIYAWGGIDPRDVLEGLDRLSNGKLAQQDGYSKLIDFYGDELYGIDDLLGTESTMFEVVNAANFCLVLLDDYSDVYALILVEKSELDKFSELATSAAVEFDLYEPEL